MQLGLSLFLAMVFVGSSCNMLDDHFPELSDEEGTRADSVLVRMQVTVLGETNQAATRAETSPTAYDTYLNPLYYNATFFETNSTAEDKPYICNLSNVTLTLQSSTSDVATYLVEGYMSSIPTNTNGHSWMTLANLPQYAYLQFIPGTTKLYDIMYKYAAFDWPAGQLPSEEHPIPMYGLFGTVYNFSRWATSDKYVYNLTTANVNLLRGLARIYVRSNDQLTDVKLMRGNTKGLAILKTLICDIPQYKEDGTPTWSNATMNIPGENSYYPDLDRGEVENIAFTKMTTLNRKYAYNYILYVPEFRNIDPTDPADTTGLCFKLQGKDYHIAFGAYENGRYIGDGHRFDIVRDYSYEYIITSTEKAPKIQYSVLPWDEKVAGDITFE
jgi:hypothetical protein